MALELEKWIKIFNVVEFISNLPESYIFEQIKYELRQQDRDTYQEWAQKSFDVNHLFDVLSNKSTSRKLALLHMAALSSNKNVFKYLTNLPAININKTGAIGMNALQLAVLNNHQEIVKYLIEEKGVNVNLVDNAGRNALHLAAEKGHKEIVALLVNLPKIDVNKAEIYGRNALHLAAEKGHKEIVALLVNLPKIDVSKADKVGRTALHIAILNGHQGVAELLIAHEIKLKGSKVEKPIYANKVENQHETGTQKLYILNVGKIIIKHFDDSSQEEDPFNLEIIEYLSSEDIKNSREAAIPIDKKMDVENLNEVMENLANSKGTKRKFEEGESSTKRLTVSNTEGCSSSLSDINTESLNQTRSPSR